MTTISRESTIKEIAYGLWESEGRPIGRDLEHYFQAERLADSVTKPATETRAAVKRVRKPRATTTARKPAQKRATS